MEHLSLKSLTSRCVFGLCFYQLSCTFGLLRLNLGLFLLLSHIELLVKHLRWVWYPKDPYDVSLNSIDDFLVSAWFVPDGHRVLVVPDWNNDAVDLFWVRELLPDNSKQQVFPKFVGNLWLDFVEPDLPSATECVGIIFPSWLDSFDELYSRKTWLIIMKTQMIKGKNSVIVCFYFEEGKELTKLIIVPASNWLGLFKCWYTLQNSCTVLKCAIGFGFQSLLLDFINAQKVYSC